MHFKNALFKIVSKIQTLVFCAFFNKIAFGKSDEEKFEEKHHFEININEISEVFCALFYIVKAFSTLKDTTGTLLKKSDTIEYVWEVHLKKKDPLIFLRIFDTEQMTYELSMTIFEFNDMVFLLGNLILPALNLKTNEQRAFQLISEMDLDQINKLKQEKTLKQFFNELRHKIENISEFEIHCTSILTQYHLDTIVAIHCIKSLYNSELNITTKNINLMLSCK